MKNLKRSLPAAFLLITYFFFLGLSSSYGACLKTKKAALRKGPGKHFKKLWDITLFSPLKVKKQNAKWVQIEDSEGIIGWIHENELTHKYFCGSVKVEKVSIQLLSNQKTKTKNKLKKRRALAFFDQNFRIVKFKKGKVAALSPLGNQVLVPRKSLWVQ